MKITLSLPLFLIMGGITIYGCQPTLEDNFEGTWNAKAPNPQVLKGGKKPLNSGQTFTLVVKPDHTFTLNMGENVSGTWEIGQGDQLALISKSVQPGSFKPSALPDFSQPVGVGWDSVHHRLTLSYGGSQNGPKLYAVFTKATS